MNNLMMENAENGSAWQGKRWRIAAWGIAGLILLAPLVAMQFTEEVNWTAGDFVFAAALLFGTLGTYELAVRKSGNAAYRWGVGCALAAVFLLVWINGAVGIIGDEGNAANLMYGGVIAVGLAGAFAARFKPAGMARALAATAAAQALVAAIALAYGLGEATEVALINGFFVALFGVSAALFSKASREQPGGRL